MNLYYGDTPITPPAEWEPMPKQFKELYWQKGCSVMLSRFVQPVQEMLDEGIIQIEFRIKNSRYPDPRNQYWWRRVDQLGLPGVAAS